MFSISFEDWDFEVMSLTTRYHNFEERTFPKKINKGLNLPVIDSAGF